MSDTFHERWKKWTETKTEAFSASMGRFDRNRWIAVAWCWWEIYRILPRWCRLLPHRSRPGFVPTQELLDIKIMSWRMGSERKRPRSPKGKNRVFYSLFLLPGFLFPGRELTLRILPAPPPVSVDPFAVVQISPAAKWGLYFDFLLLPDGDSTWKVSQMASLASGGGRALLSLTSRKRVGRLSTGGLAVSLIPVWATSRVGGQKGGRPSLFSVAAATWWLRGSWDGGLWEWSQAGFIKYVKRKS